MCVIRLLNDVKIAPTKVHDAEKAQDFEQAVVLLEMPHAVIFSVPH